MDDNVSKLPSTVMIAADRMLHLMSVHWRQCIGASALVPLDVHVCAKAAEAPFR